MRIGCSTFVFILFRSLPVSLCSDHQYFLFPPKISAMPCVIYCMRWQIENVPSQSRLPSCLPLTADTAPAFFLQSRHFYRRGGRFISICQLHLTLASRDWKVAGFSAQLIGKNPNHFSFIYAALLTVEIVSRHKPRVRPQDK